MNLTPISLSKPDGYLLRYGEIALKGHNRDRFVGDLIQIIKPRIAPLGGKVEVKHQRLLLRFGTEVDPQAVRAALSTVFGISGISPFWRVAPTLEAMAEKAWELLGNEAGSDKSFGIKVKRNDKAFPMDSMAIQTEVANALLRRGLSLRTNLRQPDLPLGITLEKKEAFLFQETWPGLGGLPVCHSARHGLLLSGGIDSPVAGNRIQKRGGYLEALYFHTPPFTVEDAREKVVELATLLAQYQNGLPLHIVNFTEAMKTIRATCQESYGVVLSRRLMMRLADRFFAARGVRSLVTGESLGQVASQTVENIGAIGHGLELPVLRPLIGRDKLEIIEIAQRIGSYETSIRPAQDCCSLFSPSKPITRASLQIVRAEESKLDLEGLLTRALESIETLPIKVQHGSQP